MNIVNKVNSDKTLSVTNNSASYQGESNVDVLQFLLPTVLNNLDISNCTISLNLIDDDNLGNVYVLTPETELYNKSYLSYLFPITTEFTQSANNYTYWLTITDAQGSILKTSSSTFKVDKKLNSFNMVVNTKVDIVDSLAISILGKADGLNYVDNFLQLKSGTNPIGQPVFISGGGGGASSAENVAYLNGDITNVKQALDKLLYSELSINLSSPTSLTQEKGTVLSNTVLNWTYSKDIVAQTLNSNTLDVALRTFTDATSFNTNKTYSIGANDGTKAFTKSLTFNFYNGIYYGVATESTYNSAFVVGLTKKLQSAKSTTFTVNCGVGQYIYYACPVTYSVPSFNVGGFDGGFSEVSIFDFTNSSGYVESYQLWRSDNSSLGNTTVVVS